jgi:hypothetical protein
LVLKISYINLEGDFKMNYGLKTIKSDYTSHDGFKWKLGKVKCEDWNEKPKCGRGLHFALNGEGEGCLFDWCEEALWVVAELPDKYVNLKGKVRVPECKVIYIGDRKSATDLIYEKCGMVACIGGTASVGKEGILQWNYFDGKRYRIHTEYVGKNKIKANTKYKGYWNGTKFIVKKVK